MPPHIQAIFKPNFSNRTLYKTQSPAVVTKTIGCSRKAHFFKRLFARNAFFSRDFFGETQLFQTTFRKKRNFFKGLFRRNAFFSNDFFCQAHFLRKNGRKKSPETNVSGDCGV